MVKGQGENRGIIRDLGKMPTPESGFQGRLELEPEEGRVGERVNLAGRNLPPEKQFQLIWRSHSMDWDIERNSDGVLWKRFLGFNYSERQELIGEVETDPEGRFDHEFEVPEDFGGTHDIYLVTEKERVNKIGFLVVPDFDVGPLSGPFGSPITVKARGLPLLVPESVDSPPYHVYYDNSYVGLISPVTAKGSAELTIPATGKPGPHVIDVERCQFGNAHSYRQTHIGLLSLPGTPDLSWTFELEEGEPVLPPPIGEQVPYSVPREGSGLKDDPSSPELTTAERAFSIHDSVLVKGAGFPPGTSVQLVWPELEGSNMREEGFQERDAVTLEVTTDEEGRLEAEISPSPKTVQGGPHPIHAMLEGKKVATTSAIALPEFEELTPESGPVGTGITINAQGVGWNEPWNQVTIVYDNSYIGYACGGDIPGIIEAKLRATGEPGWHLIDIYPTVQKQRNFAKEAFEIPFIYRLPILNWESHPEGYHFRYAFKVEEGS